jgi:DNA-binding response OmpR family regulator
MTEDAKKPLGRILLSQRALTPADLDKALKDTSSGSPLATRLTESGAVTELAALKALSEQSGVPGMDLNQVCIRLSDLALVPREIAIKHRLLPVLARDDRVFLAMATPTDRSVIDELEFVTGKRVFPYIALSGPLMRVIAAAYEMRERGEPYYVGPSCPAEVLRRAGISAITPPAGLGRAPRSTAEIRDSQEGDRSARSATEATFRPATASPAPGPTVVVDDAMRKMVSADELSYAGFGDADRDLSTVGQIPGAPVPGRRAGEKTLLVVDDEPDIRKMLRRIFGDRGYRVIEADRGLTALRMVKEHQPDVMILDAMLPEVHGFEIARRIKGTELYGHIPIVMISAVYRGWRFAEDLKTSYGVEAYLEKPFKVADVVAAVETALQKGGGRADTERISADAERKLRAGIAAYQAGDMDTAAEHLREGTRIDPLAYRLHFHLGLLYGKQGQVYDAIQELETALHINGRHFAALKNLAVLYQKAGFRNKAIETWERALGVAPDEPTRQSIKEHLLGLL